MATPKEAKRAHRLPGDARLPSWRSAYSDSSAPAGAGIAKNGNKTDSWTPRRMHVMALRGERAAPAHRQAARTLYYTPPPRIAHCALTRKTSAPIKRGGARAAARHLASAQTPLRLLARHRHSHRRPIARRAGV